MTISKKKKLSTLDNLLVSNNSLNSNKLDINVQKHAKKTIDTNYKVRRQEYTSDTTRKIMATGANGKHMQAALVLAAGETKKKAAATAGVSYSYLRELTNSKYTSSKIIDCIRIFKEDLANSIRDLAPVIAERAKQEIVSGDAKDALGFAKLSVEMMRETQRLDDKETKTDSSTIKLSQFID